jgi:3-oxoacyl-[acyl-carrier protein] reductase
MKVCVITGAGRGIGRATAELLAGEGHRLVLAARTVSEIEETAEIARGIGAECLAIPTDVRSEDECEELIERTIEAYGQIDTLINNAGAAILKPVWELSREEFELNLLPNLGGTFFCSRAALRHMMPRRRGTIINIASSSGLKPYLTQGAYCASKAGVIALSKVMAMELRPHNIRVHVICPGGVDTRLAEEIHPTRDKTGWIQPEDVAQTIGYLLSLAPNVTVDEIVIRRFDADPI